MAQCMSSERRKKTSAHATRKTEQVIFRCTPEEKARIEALADSLKLDVGEVVRRVFAMFFDGGDHAAQERLLLGAWGSMVYSPDELARYFAAPAVAYVRAELERVIRESAIRVEKP